MKAAGELRSQVGHVIDIMTTCVEIGEAKYPSEIDGVKILPSEGVSLVPAFEGQPLVRDFLAWEHEGNRACAQAIGKSCRLLDGRGRFTTWQMTGLK